MPRSRELPPPPANPPLSPPVFVAGEEQVMIPGLTGEPAIEAAVRIPPRARRGVLLCHPHPLYGGTMHSAVVLAIAKVLAELAPDVASLRFNYRGVGKSEGAYAHGVGETLDVRAALRALRERLDPSAPVSLCGYSFGTWIGLRAAVQEGTVERVVLVAPAVRLFQFLAEDGRALARRIAIFIGDNDEFCDVDEAAELAATLGADLSVLQGDHYFLKSRRRMAEAVVPALVRELPARAL